MVGPPGLARRVPQSAARAVGIVAKGHSRICEEMTTESRMTLARRTPRGRRTLTFWGFVFSVHTFPPLEVDVGAASKCVGFLHKTALAVVDVEVVLGKEFRPPACRRVRTCFRRNHTRLCGR